jgi:hypothetical protein
MQQDILEASDEVARKYFDETEEKDRDPAWSGDVGYARH